MAYDPLELAAYLRKARHPTEGFTPSFTNVDRAGPYDFDVRSPEEMAGIGMEEEEELDPIASILDRRVDPDNLESPDAILEEIRGLEDIMDQMVRDKQRDTEEKFGVTQARELYQTFAAVGSISPDNMLYQRAAQDLQAKMQAASLSFGVVDEDTLVGTEAAMFRPLESRLKALDDRLNLIEKAEAEQQILDRETRTLDRQLAKEARGKESAQEELLQRAAVELRIDSGTIDYIKKIKGDELRAEDITSLPLASLDLYKRAAAGQKISDPVTWASKDARALDTYQEIIEQDATIPEERKETIRTVLSSYKEVAAEADRIADRDLFDNKQDWRETVALPTDLRKQAIDQARAKKARELIIGKSKEYTADVLTFSNMTLDDDPNFTTMHQVAANAIISLMKNEFGVNNLLSLTQQGQSVDGISQMQRVRNAYETTIPGKQGIPFNHILDAMIEKLIYTVNTEGQDLGIAVSPKDDPAITTLRMLNQLSGLTVPGIY